jgi:hypothetical protein
MGEERAGEAAVKPVKSIDRYLSRILPPKPRNVSETGPGDRGVIPASVPRRDVHLSIPRPPATARETSLQGILDRICSTEASEGPWTASDGQCMDISARWVQRLAREGVESWMRVADPAGGHRSAVDPRLVGKTHAYVWLPSEKTGPVLMDPTIRQFFTEPHGKIPEIFVGSENDLRALFRAHRSQLRAEIQEDPHAGTYEPDEFVSVAYGLGPHADRRMEVHLG